MKADFITGDRDISGEKLIEYSQKVGSFYVSLIESLTKTGDVKPEYLDGLPNEIIAQFRDYRQCIDKNCQLQKERFLLKKGGSEGLLSENVKWKTLDKELTADKSKYELEEIDTGNFVVFMDDDLYSKLHCDDHGVVTLKKDGVSFISMRKKYREEEYCDIYRKTLQHEIHHII